MQHKSCDCDCSCCCRCRCLRRCSNLAKIRAIQLKTFVKCLAVCLLDSWLCPIWGTTKQPRSSGRSTRVRERERESGAGAWVERESEPVSESYVKRSMLIFSLWFSTAAPPPPPPPAAAAADVAAICWRNAWNCPKMSDDFWLCVTFLLANSPTNWVTFAFA